LEIIETNEGKARRKKGAREVRVRRKESARERERERERERNEKLLGCIER
jgi:hypothetical protein